MWIAITVMAVGPSIAWAWTVVRRTKSEHELKRTMIEQGMSADEIERVLAAGSAACDKKDGGAKC